MGSASAHTRTVEQWELERDEEPDKRQGISYVNIVERTRNENANRIIHVRTPLFVEENEWVDECGWSVRRTFVAAWHKQKIQSRSKSGCGGGDGGGGKRIIITETCCHRRNQQ